MDTKLGSFSVEIPHYVVESSVEYRTIRRPTVFESMALKLISEFQRHEVVSGMSVCEIFESQLGVSSTDGVLKAAMEEISAVQMIRFESGGSVEKCPLKHLGLTDEGRKFLKTGQLPSRPKYQKVWHVYSPLTGKLVGRARHISAPTQIDINSGTGAEDGQRRWETFVDELHPSDQSAAVRAMLKEERHEWISENTVIDKIESRVLEVRPENHELTLMCSSDGTMSLKSKNRALDSWLERMDPEFVWNHIIGPAVCSGNVSVLPDLGHAAVRDARSVSLLTTVLKGNRADPPGGRSFYACTDETRLERTSATVKILVREKNHPYAGYVQERTGDEGLFLGVGVPESAFPAGLSGIYIENGTTEPRLELKGVVWLYWGGQPRQVEVFVDAGDCRSAPLWIELGRSIDGRLIGGGNEAELALTSLWKGGARAIWKWQDQIPASSGGVLGFVESAKGFYSWMRRLKGNEQLRWIEDWSNAMNVALERCISINGYPKYSIELIKGVVLDLEKIGFRREASVMEALVECCDRISNVEEIKMFRSIAGEGFDIPVKMFKESILNEWISVISSGRDVSGSVYGPHAYAKIMIELSRAYKAVHRDIGLLNIHQVKSGDFDFRSVTPSALNAALKWLDVTHPDRLVFRNPVSDSHYENSQLTRLRREVEEWLDVVSSRFAPREEEGRRVVVLDSNALMDDRVTALPVNESDVLVIPAPVFDELERLKNSGDQRKAGRVRAANRLLVSEKFSWRIQNLDEDIVRRLLGGLDAGIVDNQILATAGYYKLNDVILVSGDNNLRAKAVSFGVRVMSPGEYLNAGKGSSAKGKGGKRK